MSKKEIDFDKELEKLARKSNIQLKKTEFAYERQFKKLDNEIDKIVNGKIKEFDKNKELTSQHLMTDYSTDVIDGYRKKLKKM